MLYTFSSENGAATMNHLVWFCQFALETSGSYRHHRQSFSSICLEKICHFRTFLATILPMLSIIIYQTSRIILVLIATDHVCSRVHTSMSIRKNHTITKIIHQYTVVILINATTLMHNSNLSTNNFGNNHFGQKYQKQNILRIFRL